MPDPAAHPGPLAPAAHLDPASPAYLFGPDPARLPGAWRDSDAAFFEPDCCQAPRQARTLAMRVVCGRPLDEQGRCAGHRYDPIDPERSP
jgi:hypothetical protein